MLTKSDYGFLVRSVNKTLKSEIQGTELAKRLPEVKKKLKQLINNETIRN